MNEVKVIAKSELNKMLLNTATELTLNLRLTESDTLSVYNQVMGTPSLKHLSYTFAIITTHDTAYQLLQVLPGKISARPTTRNFIEFLILTVTLDELFDIITKMSNSTTDTDLCEIFNKLQTEIEKDYPLLFNMYRKQMQKTHVYYLEEK